ncbi:sensor histidine kinase [Hymenobacter taeanensis]|uniref:histidine kinase n=1 Tax=Hymenobacter taeanensis TaxID=2735321 RepID=A0A6M6BIB0_9BACT|nr:MULTISPECIES: sensor histidine kinase [Hymenobacter]QJX47769.1 sensor histidine kinase [Hymenobacter taeanensis]UOQ82742.1 sensor histidine kinase [Hymenobacter sp. 5414T-23]
MNLTVPTTACVKDHRQRTRRRAPLAVMVLLVLLTSRAPAWSASAPPDALHRRFFALLQQGDSVYARKQGYGSFGQALLYYDRAERLAEQAQDSLLLAEAVFARARVYDAWNHEPQKTLRYFQQAAQGFAHLPGKWRRYYYARFLVAHAYDKVPDSLRAVQALRQLGRELAARPDSVRRQVPSTVEMALSATQINNFGLADTLLGQLVRRAWVRNDPETYNYLDDYYLVQARLDVLYRHPGRYSPYLDSLRLAFTHAPSPPDREYHGRLLAELLAAAGAYREAYAYADTSRRMYDRLNSAGAVAHMRRVLAESETQRQALAETRQQARQLALAGLSVGLAVISVLCFYLYRQGRRARQQAAALATANQHLDEQAAEVGLLNKEIQHRVKNNLHMVFSLLQMQERRTDNEEVIEQLQAARLRVESIAALHNQLLNGAGAEVNLAAFLKELVSSVVSCLANDRQVVTHLQTEGLNLPPNGYLPLSLILNEWVTNTIKYAATDSPFLEVRVTVKNSPTEVCVEYQDNGCVPTAAAAPGLGTQIITLLTRQLGATLSTPFNHPYHYQLRIPHGLRA